MAAFDCVELGVAGSVVVDVETVVVVLVVLVVDFVVVDVVSVVEVLLRVVIGELVVIPFLLSTSEFT